MKLNGYLLTAEAETSASVKADGLLTEEELADYEANFKLPYDVIVPGVQLRGGKMLSLGEEVGNCLTSHFTCIPSISIYPVGLYVNFFQPDESDRPSIDLSNWVPWQNRLQPTGAVTHGRHSKNLVHLMELMDVQSWLNAESLKILFGFLLSVKYMYVIFFFFRCSWKRRCVRSRNAAFPQQERYCPCTNKRNPTVLHQ